MKLRTFHRILVFRLPKNVIVILLGLGFNLEGASDMQTGLLLTSLCFVVGVVMNLSCYEITADKAFNRWINLEDPCFQFVFDDINVSTMAKNLNDFYLSEFNRVLNKGNKQEFLTKCMTNFFYLEKRDSDSMLGFCYDFQLSARLKRRLEKTYTYLDSDVWKFIKYMKRKGFSDGWINKVENEANFLNVIDKYRYFARLLFLNSDSKASKHYPFCVANKFFEFCFNPNTWPKFKKIIKNQEDYPIARMIYSIMWYHLAGIGWKDWSKSALDSLYALARDGKTIVYIAGGTDIYQLLKYGIYNVKIIDPVLPTQPIYYSDTWDWFVRSYTDKDGIGDRVSFNFGDTQIYMRRDSFRTNGIFRAELSDEQAVDIVRSTTTWGVYDTANNLLGSVTFERRFCEQADFCQSKNDVLLLSFNELYYIVSNDEEESWGIDISKFDKDIKIFVKQLHNPVNKIMLCNMQKADNSYFSFIKLGSNTN